jgi:hypothetical protein
MFAVGYDASPKAVVPKILICRCPRTQTCRVRPQNPSLGVVERGLRTY